MSAKCRLQSSLYAVLGACVVLAGCGRAADQPAPPQPAASRPAVGTVRIEWFGQAMFLLTTHSGLRLVTDPFNDQLGYPLPHPEADIVTVTHEHSDHNATGEVRGKFETVRGPGEHKIKGLVINGISAFHDEEQGKKRGLDTIFCFALDRIRFCHLGDLGQPKLTPEQLKAIGPVDVLMIPVGGYYTISGKTAWTIIGQLKPRVIIPMHYKTKVLNPKIPIHPVDEFTAGHKNVLLVKTGVIGLDSKTLPKEGVFVLDRFD